MFIPIFVISFYLPGFYGDIIPLILFLIASFTDFLDGLLARMYKEESKLGELLDPVADKIIIASALVLLVMDDIIKDTRRVVMNSEAEFGVRLNINKVLDEAGRVTGIIAANLGFNVTAIADALATSKQLGMSLKDLEGTSNSLLNFQYKF